ncbi:MAG: BrnT family toxin [Acidobacteria bacterium]|nr:BrnT family toxin [Acidobacteriota bacterium]
MKFTWDEIKAEKVKRDHAVEFAKIIDIFEDAFAIEYIDEDHSTDEETRYAIIGLTSYGLVYLVFTELKMDELHFITARLAENWMVKEYEENRKRK